MSDESLKNSTQATELTLWWRRNVVASWKREYGTSLYRSLACGLCLTVAIAASRMVRAEAIQVLDPKPLHLSDFQLRVWEEIFNITALAQTPDGFLWVGTTRGLYRFDGRTFERWPRQSDRSGVAENLNTVRIDRVHALFVDSDGSLLVATGAGYREFPRGLEQAHFVDRREGPAGLLRVRDGHIETLIKASETPRSWIWAYARTSDQEYWVGTEDGVIRYSRGESSVFRTGRVDEDSISGFWFHADGTVTVASAGGIRRLDPKHGWLPMPPTPYNDDAVIQIYSVSNDSAWLVQKSGFRMVKNDDATTFVEETNGIGASVGPSGFWGVTADHLRFLGDGRVPQADLSSFVKAPISLYHATPPLRDREGNLWIGGRDGLIQGRKVGIRNLGTEELGLTIGFSVLEGADGAMWLSSDTGVFRIDSDLATQFIPISGKASHSRNMARVKDGSIWVGDRSLIHATKTEWSRIEIPAPSPGHSITPFVDANGDLWLTGYEDSLYRYAGADLRKSPTVYTVKDGLCPGASRGINQGKRGELWLFSGPVGVTRFQNGTGRCFGREQGLPNTDVTGVYETDDGTVWMTMTGSVGLLRLKNGKVFVFDGETGLPSGTLLSLTPAEDGAFWMTSDLGVVHARIADLDGYADGKRSSVPVSIIDRESGMAARYCIGHAFPSAALTRNGDLWVPTADGFSVITPEALEVPLLPRPVFDRFVVDGERVFANNGVLQIPHGSDHLTIEFNVPRFVRQNTLRFRHSLVASDSPEKQTWSKGLSETSVSLAALTSGLFTFSVRAEDRGFDASSEKNFGPTASIAIEFLPPWYEGIWFRLSMPVLFLGLMLLFGLVRARRVRNRYELILAERSRIARELHDGLAQLWTGIGYQLDGLLLRLTEQPPEILDRLSEARRQVERAGEQSRKAIFRLRSSHAGGGLRSAIETVIQTFRARNDLSIELSFRGRVAPDPTLEHEIPMIVQEALANATQHGHATHVHVDANVDQDEFAVRITDNGTGFGSEGANAQQGRGLGILGMQERARLCGGRFAIETGPAGTTVTVRVPVPPISDL